MFGISFGELLVIGVIGLVVLGPERLPAVARTLGRLMRQVQDYTNAFKAELNRELHNAEILELEKELKAEGRQLQAEVQAGLGEEFSTVQQRLEDALSEPDPWHAGSAAPKVSEAADILPDAAPGAVTAAPPTSRTDPAS